MEVVGLLASITSLVEASQKLFKFAQDVYEADSQRWDVLQQLSCLDAVSTSIDKLKASDPSGDWTQDLDPADPKSPACGLMVAVGKVEILLRVNVDNMPLRAKLENFKWHWKKKQLEPLFQEINQHCVSILVVLGWGQTDILSKIGSITRTTADNINSMREFMEEDRRKRDEVNRSMMRMAETVRNLEASDKVRQTEQEKAYRKEVEKWLSPLEFHARQQAIFNKLDSFQGSSIGQWFFEGKAFEYWKSGSIKLLKGVGEPGAGKTVLCSVVVDKLTKEYPEIPVLCIFLEKAESLKQIPEALQGSLLKQLIQFKESGLSPNIRKAFDKATRTNTAPDDNQTKDLLKAEIELYSQVYLVVDGLDEASEEARWFIENDLREIDTGKMSVFTTSRPDQATDLSMNCHICGQECVRYYLCTDCEECEACHEQHIECLTLCVTCFEGGNCCPHDSNHNLQETMPEEYEVTISTPDRDIEIFVIESIKADMAKKLPKTSLSRNDGRNELARACARYPELFEQVRRFIVENAEGRFLLAREFVKSFKKKYTLGDIKRMLRTQGSIGIFPLYDEDMSWIMKQESGDLARQIFSLVYHAKRNLTLLELQQALATQNGDPGHDADDVVHEGDILKVTKGLIGIDRLEPTGEDPDVLVRFDHLTRREYFDKTWQTWFETGQVDFANKCLSFLNFEVFATPCASEAFKVKEKELPFISYAVQFWGEHVRDVGQTSAKIMAKAVAYMKDASRVDAYIQAAWAANTRHRDKWDVRRSIHPLHICGWFGLEHLIPALGYGMADIDIKESTHQQTALMYACRRGNVETVRRFLELGADVNKQSRKGRTPLFEAIQRLRKDTTSNDLNNETKLLKKAFNSRQDVEKSEQIVTLLLTSKGGNNFDPNIRNPKMLQRTALMTSIAYNQAIIALKILNQTGVNVNIADIEGTTALCLSARYGMAEVVARLLQFPSIDINASGTTDQRTALLFAARHSPAAEVVELLLNKGADPNKPDARGRTPLVMSLLANNEDAFQTIAGKSGLGIDLTCTDKDGRSLTHWAAEAGNLCAIDVLHAKSLPVEPRDSLGMTPLHDACRCGKAEAAGRLLEFGADRNVEDSLGRTPAEIALQYGHVDLVNICKTGQGAELNTTDFPAWSLATTRKLDKIAELVSSKPSLDIREPRTERTALHCLLLSNFRDEEDNVQIPILKILLNEGHMSADETDTYGQTPLHFAAMFGNLEATRLLLEQDITLDAVDSFGLTPLLIACKNKYLNVATLLIEEGATIDPQRMDLEEMLFAALKLESQTAVSRLIAAGADRMAMDEDGRTPDMIAEQSEDKELIKIMKAARSTRIKAPTKSMSTKYVVSELRDAIEEVDEILEEAHSGVMLNGIPARNYCHTPFSARNFDLGKEIEHGKVEEVEAKQMPHLESKPRREDEVEKMLGDVSLTAPSTFFRHGLVEEPLGAG
ncbi:ankyrin repeat-containing domain protein [Cadophora sp. MPI-SDFR-AT-0126]|nr:ankyrin repeat-containing domain protein [Leotiomycetes sp. MPI-SDFR-AT-0126]